MASVDVIASDDRKGAVLAVQHLYELGHRDIAHLDGGNVPGGGNTRRRGYVDAMTSLGLERQVRIAGGGFTLAHGADGVDQLSRGRVPTAIFAANDVLALGALERLAELGLSSPADVSVVGYDNSSYAAQRKVGLTSVDQPHEQIGELAATLLAGTLRRPHHSEPARARTEARRARDHRSHLNRRPLHAPRPALAGRAEASRCDGPQARIRPRMNRTSAMIARMIKMVYSMSSLLLCWCG